MPTTYMLTVDLRQSAGEALVGAVVQARLAAVTNGVTDRDTLLRVTDTGETVWSRTECGRVDANGQATLELLPNAVLAGESVYIVTVLYNRETRLLGLYRMPAVDSALHTLTPVVLE